LLERIERLSHQSALRFERQFLRKDNQTVLVEVSLSAAGEDHYQELVRDITERKEAEEKFRLAVEASPSGIVLVNREGNIALANTQTERMFGYDRDELMGKPVEMLLPERFASEHSAYRAKFLAAPEARAMGAGRDLFARRRDGSEFPVEIGLNPIQIPKGLLVLANVVDITERKRAEQQLRKQAELLSLAHDAIIVRDTKGQIKFWNRGAEKTYGWTAAEAIGRIMHHLLQTKFPASLSALEATLEEQGEWEGELVHTARGGRKIIVTSRQSLRRDEHNTPSAVMEINRDVTERKHAEEEIHKLNQELEQRVIERTEELQAVNKELEAFAYSVSHDLRAPVRHIAGFTELLEKHSGQFFDEKGLHYTQQILDSANRMGTLVDDLLAFSRIGRAETQQTLVNLEQLVKSVVSEIAPDTRGRKISWLIGHLPICYGDPAMLRLVFSNLISNAVKFTRTRGEARIEIGFLNHKSDEIVAFTKDNGVGFDMKYKDKLFGVFQRLHSQEAFEGTGIGLATVQRIVHRHGGRVWAEGSVDTGATFYVALPKPVKVSA
jgi:PAS domain S-box-containing protein